MHTNGSAHNFLNWFAFHNPAVDIFFCLSSFTLCLVYGAGTGRRLHFRPFAVARFARIYPLYAIVFAVSATYSAVLGLNFFKAYSWPELIADGVRQALMVNAWPVIGSGAHWIDPMWSLSVEAFCYALVFPVLFGLSGWGRKLPWPILVAGVIVCSIVTLGFYILFYHPEINAHRVPPATGFLVRWVAPVRGTCMFGAGWLAYLLYLEHPTVRDIVTKWAGGIAVVMILIVAGPAAGIGNAELLVLLTPFLILGLMDPRSLTARLLAGEPLHFLGLISYSLYLLHWPVMIFAMHFLRGSGLYYTAQVAVSVGFAISAAVISYFFIERPARGWIRLVLMPKPVQVFHAKGDNA